MADPCNLVVPVHLQALCVGSEGASLLGPSADFSHFPYLEYRRQRGGAFLSTSIDMFVPNTSGPGVHLHWSLPDALMHGVHDQGSDKIVFPAVPDRWLVTRLLSNGGSAPERKSWIVESNRESQDGLPGMPSKPTSDGPPYFYRYLGGVFDYDEWVDSNANGRLTALGYGLWQMITGRRSKRVIYFVVAIVALLLLLALVL